MADIFEEAYANIQKEEGPVEIELDEDDGEFMVNGKSQYEKRTNIEDLLGKVEVNKPRMIGLKSFHKMKGKERKFNNEKPSKECIMLQE